MKFIYLSGGMDGLSLADARSWRSDVTKDLAKKKIGTIDPTLKVDNKFLKTNKRLMQFDCKDFEDTAEGIILKDMAAIRKSDALLCNLLSLDKLTAEQGPVGTFEELFYAYRILHMPTFVVTSLRFGERPWVKGNATKIFYDLPVAIQYIVNHQQEL